MLLKKANVRVLMEIVHCFFQNLIKLKANRLTQRLESFGKNLCENDRPNIYGVLFNLTTILNIYNWHNI